MICHASQKPLAVDACPQPNLLLWQSGRTARAQRSGWCLSFVSQYDVELLHKIEALIGVEMQKFELAEEDVLKGITKVLCWHAEARVVIPATLRPFQCRPGLSEAASCNTCGNQVYTAKRAAALRLAEEASREGFNKQSKKRPG